MADLRHADRKRIAGWTCQTIGAVRADHAAMGFTGSLSLWHPDPEDPTEGAFTDPLVTDDFDDLYLASMNGWQGGCFDEAVDRDVDIVLHARQAPCGVGSGSSRHHAGATGFSTVLDLTFNGANQSEGVEVIPAALIYGSAVDETWPTNGAAWDLNNGGDDLGEDGQTGFVKCTLATTGTGSPKLIATPGAQYQWSAYMHEGLSGKVCTVTFYNADEDVLSAHTIHTTTGAGDTWTSGTIDVTAPANTAYMLFSASSVCLYDHVTLAVEC